MNKDVVDRFWDKAKKSNGCWNWSGSKTNKGYGRFLYEGKARFAHRMAWIIHFGNIPNNLMVCHKCDNPSCVNPDHLFLGDNRENQRDSVRKNRHWSSRKTECKWGHPLAGDNIYYRSNGKRICKICANKQSAATYRRKVYG